jgi:UDP-N-acetyl-D-galactosamine dehydrogenase
LWPELYDSVVTKGVYRAKSIRVAEAAKIIENTQRDVNVALMNELAVLFDRLGIETKDVLDAAGTKWNFLKVFSGPCRWALYWSRSILSDI